MEAATYGFISLLPPLLAIGLAIWSRRIYLSLAAGIWLGWAIVAGWNPGSGFAGAVDATVRVLGEPDNARVIMFTFGIGALIAVVEGNGGVRGFVEWVERRRWVTTGRRAQMLACVMGVVIFIESNITILVAGAVSRPLFDRFRVSREKLAYLIDSTSAPICIMIPLNAWGAYVLGILGTLGVEEALGAFVGALPLNFYAIAAILLAFSSAILKLDWGPMKAAEDRTAEGKLRSEEAVALADPEEIAPAPPEDIAFRPVNMIVPIGVMVLTMPLGLWITGDGNFADGSGTTSVLWAVLAGLAAGWILTLFQRLVSADDLGQLTLKGAGGLTGMALVLLLALTLADVTRVMGTGEYLAGVVAGTVPLWILVPLVFLTAGVIAFATGSSWGTFAIVLPLAVPLAVALGTAIPPFIAAVLSGGVFGDHCSPISDTTIISSLAAGTDHIDHVRTQLPYALSAGAVATLGFAAAGVFLGA